MRDARRLDRLSMSTISSFRKHCICHPPFLACLLTYPHAVASSDGCIKKSRTEERGQTNLKTK